MILQAYMQHGVYFGNFQSDNKTALYPASQFNALVDSELAIFLILHVSCHPRHLVFQIVVK